MTRRQVVCVLATCTAGYTAAAVLLGAVLTVTVLSGHLIL